MVQADSVSDARQDILNEWDNDLDEDEINNLLGLDIQKAAVPEQESQNVNLHLNELLHTTVAMSWIESIPLTSVRAKAYKLELLYIDTNKYLFETL